MTTTPEKPRRGRPFKEPKQGKRAPLSLLVRAEIKRLVDKRARDNGRTQSQEAEMLIERCLHFESLLTTDADALPTLLQRHGYTRIGISNPRTGQRGFAWVEPGVLEESGFIADEEKASPQQEGSK